MIEMLSFFAKLAGPHRPQTVQQSHTVCTLTRQPDGSYIREEVSSHA